MLLPEVISNCRSLVLFNPLMSVLAYSVANITCIKQDALKVIDLISIRVTSVMRDA